MNKISHWFRGFASRPGDSSDVAFKKMLILIIALSCSTCGLVWSAMYFAVFGYGLTMILPLSFADSRAPQEVATFQNTVFSELINIVRAHKGIVLQILGDGIYAVFGAPLRNETHVVDAVHASYAMLEKIKELGEEGIIPPIRVGIGLHTGKVIAGELGNEYRKLYSLTGSNVIIASRIEQLNKDFKSQFLVSEAIYQTIKERGHPVTSHGTIKLKGLAKPVGVYQLA